MDEIPGKPHARAQVLISVGARAVFARREGPADFSLTSDSAPDVSLGTLRDAIRRYLDEAGDDAARAPLSASLNVCIDDVAPLPWEETPMIFIDLVSGDYLPIEVAVRSIKDVPLKVITRIVSAVLEEHGCRLSESEASRSSSAVHESADPGAFVWTVEALCPAGMTVAQICDLRKELNYSTFFTNQSFADPRAVYELVRAGGAERLLGMQENEWLEVKSAPYEMKRDKQWQCELAEDVARFANSEYGGIIIVGVRSEKVDGRDTLRKLSPLPPDGRRVQSYHQSIDSHIHPPVERLLIGNVPVGNGEVLCILIPPQPEERKPFLVQGAFVDGKYQRGLISIVRRRGEHSIPITAREIHAMLVAGRALLRLERESPLPEGRES
ncbi:helix-turn-helix domain-containing protein [Microbispora hainanensis]|uniref:AlbA family DNA-binding domain-containing protein n=1 Tax=Microbispora hainanensis TaxID=568844 RepID=UPI00324AE0CB